MASGKDIYEAKIYAANIFAAGVWRGVGPVAAIAFGGRRRGTLSMRKSVGKLHQRTSIATLPKRKGIEK